MEQVKSEDSGTMCTLYPLRNAIWVLQTRASLRQLTNGRRQRISPPEMLFLLGRRASCTLY